MSRPTPSETRSTGRAARVPASGRANSATALVLCLLLLAEAACLAAADAAQQPSIDALVKALRDGTDAERAKAERTLVDDIGSAALPTLLEALKAPDRATRVAAIRVLGQLKDKFAVTALVSVLDASDPGVRTAAAEALTRADHQAIAEALVPGLNEPGAEHRKARVALLTRIGWQPASDYEKAAWFFATDDAAGLEAMGRPGEEALLRIFRESRRESRRMETSETAATGCSCAVRAEGVDMPWAAAKMLGKVGGEYTVRMLFWAMRTDFSMHRPSDIPRALGMMRNPRAIDALLAEIDHGDEFVFAALALGDIGDKRAVEPLLKALGHPSYTVRWAAVRALAKLGDKRAVEPITELLKTETDTAVREAAEQALKALNAQPPAKTP